MEELLHKVDVFLRRTGVNSNEAVQVVYRHNGFIFDYPNLVLITAEGERTLTQKEADILKFLMDRKNHLVERSMILNNIWGENDYFLGRSLDVFISRLRKYLLPVDGTRIVNVHGIGFKLMLEE